MARISLNARRSLEEPITSEMEVVFLHIDHAELPTPIRLSTDPTVLLSEDPLRFGTHSSWLQDEGENEPFLFMIADAVLPEDKAGGQQVDASLSILAIGSEVVEILRSIPVGTPAQASLAVALVSDPDTLNAEYRKLELSAGSVRGSTITLTLTGPDFSRTPHPAGRQTQSRFPGQYR